jgi:hypothetical protein
MTQPTSPQEDLQLSQIEDGAGLVVNKPFGGKSGTHFDTGDTLEVIKVYPDENRIIVRNRFEEVLFVTSTEVDDGCVSLQ